MKKKITEFILFILAIMLISLSGRIHHSHEYLGYLFLCIGSWIIAYYWEYKH